MSDNGIIKLDSPDGRRLEIEARVGTDGSVLHSAMLKVFAKQVGSSCCGIQSCSMVLNAHYCNRAGLSQDQIVFQNLPYREEKIFDYRQTLKVTNLERVETNGRGCDLNEVASILEAHGLKVKKYNGQSMSQLTSSEFRKIASEALSSWNNEIIVNYFMNDLDPTFPLLGHHSPLGGYHVKTDRFLVLDVWKDTPESWVKTETIFKAMNTLDDSNGGLRGFLLAGR